MSYHDVLLVAFDVTGNSLAQTQTALVNLLPKVSDLPESDDFGMDSWWIANDERIDRSDCDSAVFVKKGAQEEARRLLRKHGLLAETGFSEDEIESILRATRRPGESIELPHDLD